MRRAAALPYGALLDLLDNATSRDALIQQLRDLARAGPASDPAVPARTAAADSLPAESGTPTFSRRIADITQAFLEGVVDDFRDALTAFQSVGPGDDARGVTLDQWISALTSLGIVIATTLLAHTLFHLLASRIYGEIDRWVAAQGARLSSDSH